MSNAGTGLKGVVLDETRIALIDGDEGKLVYRGYNIHDLAQHATFEEVSYLLVYGSLPTRHQLADFDIQLKASRAIPQPVGTHTNELLARQVNKAEADQFVIYLYEWQGDTAFMGPFGARHVEHMVGALPGSLHPVIIEPDCDKAVNDQRRQTIVALTAEGRRVLEKMGRHAERQVSELLSSLTAAERQRIQGGLEILIRELDVGETAREEGTKS